MVGAYRGDYSRFAEVVSIGRRTRSARRAQYIDLLRDIEVVLGVNKIFGALVRYGGILCAGFIVFTLLHIVGNGIPYEVARERFAVAFERDNLSVRGFAREYDLQSVHNLRGEEQFIECQIGRTILGDSQKTIDSRG